MTDEAKETQNTDRIPEYLKHFPGLYMRKGTEIVEALAEDIEVAKRYPETKEKGKVVGGKRLTIFTKKRRYKVNEEVRVIHVMEVAEPGHKIFVMGPKPIYGEYVDDKLVTPRAAPEQIYDGLVLDSPGVDYNYDITSYRFVEPGPHRIHWQIGELRSNTLRLEVTA